jgi:hypothetical protein
MRSLRIDLIDAGQSGYLEIRGIPDEWGALSPEASPMLRVNMTGLTDTRHSEFSRVRISQWGV